MCCTLVTTTNNRHTCWCFRSGPWLSHASYTGKGLLLSCITLSGCSDWSWCLLGWGCIAGTWESDSRCCLFPWDWVAWSRCSGCSWCLLGWGCIAESRWSHSRWWLHWIAVSWCGANCSWCLLGWGCVAGCRCSHIRRWLLHWETRCSCQSVTIKISLD